MRIVLADIKSERGFVNKDTAVGGYGQRMTGFCAVTRLATFLRNRLQDAPSVTMAYQAAILARAGHEVVWTRREVPEGDVALVLSSLVDHKQETAWAAEARAKGMRVGFLGITASKLPHLFAPHADFLVNGEPEEAVMRLARGETLTGYETSEEIADLDSLPFPRWDLVGMDPARPRGGSFTRPLGAFSLLASRSCPEFCTYCPHRILSTYRSRSVANLVEELAQLCDRYPRPFVVFRDPLFSQDRERCLELADQIQSRGLDLHWECETRLDRLDDELLTRMQAAGLRAITFGVESLSPDTLKKVGRRPIPEAQQRKVIESCNRLGIGTVGFYVFAFNSDTWASIAATIDYSISLGSTLAQFKLLMPYPGTPLFKHMEKQIFEKDWERFDGFSPVFQHPNLTPEEMQFLLGAAYTRFYLRPSFLAGYARVKKQWLHGVVRRLDAAVAHWHGHRELESMSRAVEVDG
jgi:anaerobic magnesium-protoporphyrin IX monomethyl ester cyclase